MAETNTNVFSNPEQNTYKSVSSTNPNEQDSSTVSNETHTRIYEYIPSAIKLDEMSIPLQEDIDSN